MKLPHWAAIAVVFVGGGLQGLASEFPTYAVVLHGAGAFLIASGLAGALVLPSILGAKS